MSRNGAPLLRKLLASVPERINGQLPGCFLPQITQQSEEKTVHTTNKNREQWEEYYYIHRQEETQIQPCHLTVSRGNCLGKQRDPRFTEQASKSDLELGIILQLS